MTKPGRHFKNQIKFRFQPLFIYELQSLRFGQDFLLVENDIVPLPRVLRRELFLANLALESLFFAALLHVEGHVGLVLVPSSAYGTRERRLAPT